MSLTEAALSPSEIEAFEREHDKVVRTEIEAFRTRAAELVEGKITEDDFRPYRLRFGVYGQRQEGVQMLRTKIPGGMLTSHQLEVMAAVGDLVASGQGAGKGHLTTRQNIQFHFVPLAKVADAMHLLADAGLTSREACFNTVRNITACPYAGLTRNEVFDVRPYAQKVAYAFLRKSLTDSMPRKFKMAFDGCTDKDCTIGAIHDLGFKARIKDGKRGFHIVVGGGLGPLPVEAMVLDEFLPEERLVNRVEAVLRVFNQHGNRSNRNKARLKFVMRERGFDWLKEQIEKEYADILENGGIPSPEIVPEGFGAFSSKPRALGQGALLPVVGHPASGDPAYDRWLETNVEEQKTTGYASVTVRLNQGNLSTDQMRQLAALARDAGDDALRLTVEQNFVLGFIPLANLPRVYAALLQIGLADAGANELADVLTCPGAYSCNLALTKSMNLGAAIREAVLGYDDPLLRKLHVKISGCPNSCGQHWIGDIGFYGNARKIDGKEIPFYQMLLGGGYDIHGVMRYGLAVQSLPAKNAPTAAKRVLEHYRANKLENESFREYVHRYKVEFFRAELADLAKPAEIDPELYKDWGDEEAFSLKLGRGECAV